MAIFTQDFRSASVDTIATFDPSQDVIDFTSLNAGRGPEEFQRGAANQFGDRARAFNDGKIVDAQGEGVSLAEVNGGTMISAGEGNSLFVANITPDQLGVGNITVDGQAIDVSPDSDLQSILDVIAPTGGVTAEGGDGDDTLTGSVGSDTLDGGAGDDILGSGRGADTLDGGEGNDTLNAGMGDDVLYGGEGDDVLFGKQQDDTLDGGAGDDTLDGGAGSDVLTGGSGEDTFVQDLRGADTITDFNPDEDTIDFRGLAEGNLTVETVDGGTLISSEVGGSLLIQGVTPDQLGASNVTVDGQALTADTAVGRILDVTAPRTDGTEGNVTVEGDALGSSTTEDVQVLDDGLTAAEQDAEDLVLKGSKGNDTLEGGSGDDFLKGGQREDILRGGEGDDRLQGDMGSDVLEGGAGNDALDGGKGFDTLDGGAGDDILTGGGAADTFVQDFSEPGNDTITDFNPEEDIIDFRGGNDFGNITVSGVEGGTLISAGEGNSLFIANVTPDQLGTGNLTVDGQTFASNSGNPDLESIFSDLADGTAVLEDPLGGSDGDDILKGSSANDVLDGGAGDDTLAGGKGTDKLEGGEGEDTLDGGRGADTIDGGVGNDILTGGTGDDILDGGAGDDILTGGVNSDTFVQDFSVAGNDTITDFNPDQDVIDFRGLDGLTNITVSEFFGDTVINTGNGNTLTFQNITPEQLSVENIKIDGAAVTAGANGSDISSLLQDASSTGDNILSGTRSDETLDGGEGRGNDDGFDIRTDALANDSDQTGEDTIEGGAGDDTPAFFTQVRGNFDSANTIRTGGEGDDTLDGGMANNTLEGGAGDDTLRGFMGDDYLVGGDGDDTLMGMGSNDVLTGGAGNDTFVQDFRDTGHDIITDFNPSEDTIALNGVQNSFEVSVTAVDGGTLIDSGTGNTLFLQNVQPDQLGASNVTINGEIPTIGPNETLESVLADTAAELQGDTLNLRGFTGSQNFTGGDGDDSLSGGDGRDNLAGGAGDDRLDGGDQNDTLAGGAGEDLLKGGRGNDSLEGGSGDDILAGGQGRDTLAGGAGDDILAGGRGDDNLTGGAGNDTFVKDFGDVDTDTITDFNLAEDVIDLKGFGGAENLSSLTVTAVDGNTLISAGGGNALIVEGVTPSQLVAQNIRVDGEPLPAEFANSDFESIIDDLASDDATVVDVNISGGGGDDTLEGGAGDDTLRGRSGDDTLRGGVGDDLLKGEKGDDTLEGGAGDDVLKGGGGDDTLEGGAGDDTLAGGRGADTFVQDFGELGNDTIRDFNPDADVIDFKGLDGDISVSEVDGGTLFSAGEGNSLFVAKVTPDLLGASNVTVDGQALTADSALGGILSDVGSVSGDDILDGGSGEDVLATGNEQTTAEDLVLKGGKGDDALEGGAGDDVLKGGKGDDTLEGGAGDDQLDGGRGNDSLEGGSGDDILAGGSGRDTLVGGAGNDTLRGETGDDTLEGGAGDDTLAGGRGEDTLEGGAGDDTLTGGKGDDTFIQDFGQPGEDTITDFNPNQDVIDFSGLNDFEDISISEVDGNTLISAGEGNTLTINNITPDQLSADNIKVDGNTLSSDNFNLQSALGGGGSDVAGGELDALSGALGGGETSTSGADGDTSTDSALGNALDNNAQQGAAPAAGSTDGAAGSDIVADEATEEAVDEEQVDEAV